MKILVTGGCGFIGSNFIRHMVKVHGDAVSIVNLDKLTYAGRPENLSGVDAPPRYRFVHGDICDPDAVREAMGDADTVVNFAAETHVDRSILGPDSFLRTDIMGVFVLLEEALRRKVKRFVQISTDEVYGECLKGSFDEEATLNPRSPYAASKSGGDRLACSYFHTYGAPVIITRASNNYGPCQYPEKLIPLFVTNALEDKPLPVYGDGLQVRDWLYVEDHCRAIDLLLQRGVPGEVYNVGGGNERVNLDITRRILRLLDKPETLIQHVTDRPAHDRRYSLDFAKIRALGYQPAADFDALLTSTVHWYRDHPGWWKPIKSGEFQSYYKTQYGKRL
jgi:dTDP-glucose 4,6-dehydratase